MGNIAMRCTKEQFEAIKPKLEKSDKKIKSISNFKEHNYLVNDFNWCGEISNIILSGKKVKKHYKIHETWNEKIFLEACGIETTPTLEEVKEYFKDAKKVESIYGTVGVFGGNVHFENDCYFSARVDDIGYLALWKNKYGYSKILTYKKPKVEMFEISKEQILKLRNHERSRYVEEWFPKAFEEDKVELEVGKWMKTPNNGLYCPKEKKYDGFLSYGFNVRGKWNELFIPNSITKNDILAIHKEVQEALEKEAVRKGYVEGVYFKDSLGRNGVCGKQIIYHESAENNGITNGNNMWIMRNGIWATIIQTITIQEAEAKLNNEFKIVVK